MNRTKEKKIYTQSEVDEFLDEVMNLGMKLRQDQLNCVDDRSGETVLKEWKNKKLSFKTLSIGEKVVLKDSKGLCDSPQEKRALYLNKEVTVKEIYPKRIPYETDGQYLSRMERDKEFNFKEVDTFFIEDDGEYFEWEIKNILL